MSLKKYIEKHRTAFEDQKMPLDATQDFELQLKNTLHTSSKQKTNSYTYFAVAASVCLLMGLGYYFIQDRTVKDEVREQLIYSMSDQVASERLQAVYDVEENYKEEDDRILGTLFSLLHKDENNNVKIATIDALVKFSENEKVRLHLIKALEEEHEPLVQIKLIQSVTVLREKRAKKPLKQLIEDKQTFPVVKENATLAMLKLKNE
ncbi:HEAT repeat domain-containing protein [Spongiimicrobium salis]|uniref:HEAT repeat domain-containing protein n=1 Tax=Spongiimicrobium salis TaxID=1667022 RepID=UPI00374DA7D8